MIILTILDMYMITKGPLGWNMVSQSTMNKETSIKSIYMICLQRIEIDVLSHMYNIVNSWSFTREMYITGLIYHAQVTHLKDNEGEAVTTE